MLDKGGGGWGSRDGTFQCLFIKCGVKILRILCRGHGEIPEPNYIGVGRFTGSYLGRVRDVPGPM